MLNSFGVCWCNAREAVLCEDVAQGQRKLKFVQAHASAVAAAVVTKRFVLMLYNRNTKTLQNRSQNNIERERHITAFPLLLK
jgi:hypothetical protein